MLYIPNDSIEPGFNLALEEYVLRAPDLDDSCLLLWRNGPSVIIGRFQNTVDEINEDYVRENGVNVVRRMTGGGSVYHDLGNLNFSFIERTAEDGINLRLFTERMANVLQRLGLNVEVSGRNDLTIDGRKFSGNAQYRYRDRVLHHGTILYEANLDNVQSALHVKAEKIASKGVKSVRSRVTNLVDYMPRRLPILEFRDLLLREFFVGGPVRERILTEGDLQAVRHLVEEKYATWDWNFGRSPDYNLRKSGRFSCGCVETYLKVDSGIIRSCRIFGDFFTDENITDLEEGLTGVRNTESDLSDAYSRLNVRRYLGGLGLDEFLQLFLDQ